MDLHPSDPLAPHIDPDAPLETLGLSVRTRNALKAVGCGTVQSILRLDLGTPIRGLGRKAKEELLVKLEDAGLSHPSGSQVSEITMLDRSLERMQDRVDAALAALTKEIGAARQRLRKLKTRTPQTSS